MAEGDATLASMSDIDGDLEFFHELFVDLPGCGAFPKTLGISPPPPPEANRRRRLLLAADKADRNSTDAAAPSCKWELIKKREKRARTTAEKENARLRRLLAAQTLTSDKIRRLIQRAQLLAARELLALPHAAAPYLGPRVDLARIAGDLDTFTRSADARLLANEPTCPPCGAGEVVVQNRIVPTPTGAALESTVEMAWLLPFEPDAIARALLANSIRLVTRKNQRHIQTAYEDATLKVVHAVSAAKEKHGRRTAKHGQITTRLEPDRSDGSQLLTLATRGGFATDAKVMLVVEGGGFIHVSCVAGHDSASLGPLSRVFWHRQICAQVPEGSNMVQAERGRWLHRITMQKERKAQRQVDKIALAFESLLLTSSRGN